jgi:hypothetical protein
LNPYASAAAVGSLIIRLTSSPAIFPAFTVACRCASSKYAGTVITASVIFSPSFASTSALIFERIIAEISSGLLSSPPNLTITRSSVPFEILNGECGISFVTTSSLNL